MRYIEQRMLLPNAVLTQEGKHVAGVGQAVRLQSSDSSGPCSSSKAVVVQTTYQEGCSRSTSVNPPHVKPQLAATTAQPPLTYWIQTRR